MFNLGNPHVAIWTLILVWIQMGGDIQETVGASGVRGDAGILAPNYYKGVWSPPPLPPYIIQNVQPSNQCTTTVTTDSVSPMAFQAGSVCFQAIPHVSVSIWPIRRGGSWGYLAGRYLEGVHFFFIVSLIIVMGKVNKNNFKIMSFSVI